MDEIGKFRLQQIKKNDGLSCVTRNESYIFNISYIELVQHVQFDTIIFQGLNEEVEIEVPTALFVNNTNNRECIGWIGGNFQPNLFSTRMLPNYPETEVSEKARKGNQDYCHGNFQVWIGNVEDGLLSNIIDFSPIVYPSLSNLHGISSTMNCDENVTITWQHDNRVRSSIGWEFKALYGLKK